MSFLVKRQSKEKILSKIAQTTMVNRSRMRDVGDTRQDYEELDSAINSGLYLKDVMNRQGEDFYYMHTLIEVTAPDPEILEQRATEVEKLCVSVDMIARRCDYKNEQAFLSSLPILALDPDIERKARRNALTSGVAAAFPFASYELSDRNGIFLGLNLYNRSPVFLDPYDDYKYTNGNWWIGGSTGAGKTVTLQCLGGRLRQQGKRVIIIAPKKGHEFRPLCEKLGGLYLRMSPSSKDCPNLMAIRRKSLDSYAKLKNIAARDDSVLADKISQLIIWFALKKKDLSEEDKSRLDSSLVEVYGRYGITFDNSSIVDENGDFRTMPIISDWYDVLSQNPDTRYLSVVLSRYVTGSAAAMASRNNIDLDIVSLGGIYYAAHYVCPGIGRMAVNDELAAFHNHTNFGKNTQRAFLFAGSSYESVIEELKTQDEKRNEKLIRYSEAYHCLHAPIHLLSCDETGAQQLQIMTVPDYRVKLTRLMLRSAYRPPPEDIAAWDGLYNGHPFVIGADMDLRRIDTAVRTAKQHGCLPIALAALEGQGSAVLLQRYADPGCATVYKVTENALSELLGRAPNLYVPPRTQFLTEKGDVVDAPLIKAPGKAGGPHRK